ncbi:hypothetical protein L195_g062729, partial [Trifolium pratense]
DNNFHTGEDKVVDEDVYVAEVLPKMSSIEELSLDEPSYTTTATT